ncbi:MAG: NUDIX pyrophosphatase, partial [Chloroflexi bacterium]|nr:NUDIX pyrophosphatase [Chloroflexota bacterium]
MKVKLDWEHVEARWVEPDDIGGYETVPELAKAWLAVKD